MIGVWAGWLKFFSSLNHFRTLRDVAFILGMQLSCEVELLKSYPNHRLFDLGQNLKEWLKFFHVLITLEPEQIWLSYCICILYMQLHYPNHRLFDFAPRSGVKIQAKEIRQCQK